MSFQITSGVLKGARKIVLYGTEGIGKTTFASKFPNPLFIDTEGSTKNYNVNRLPKPTSWQMLVDEVKYVIQTRPCKTLVIDTADWAERMCVESVCARYGKKGIEDFGYGNGYTYVAEEWGRFLNLLQDVIDVADINVILTAHATIRKFEQPNEMGAYDRYELKLGKKTTAQTAPITKEWADMVLFANYKTYSIAADEKGKKHKAQGGQRVMYTAHHPCWDAKNRDGLAEELPFDYSSISHLFKEEIIDDRAMRPSEPHTSLEIPKDDATFVNNFVTAQDDQIVSSNEIVEMNNEFNNIPKALADLMKSNNVSKYEIESIVSRKGYYPLGTPIENYDPEFISGVLIGAWDKVYEQIKEDKALPF